MIKLIFGWWLIVLCAATGLAQTPPTTAKQVITNKDLERIRRTREQSERDYEQRRRELGLPSRAEAEERRVNDEEKLVAYAAARQALDDATEQGFANRAALLREELAAVTAQINFYETQLNDFNLRTRLSSFVTVAPVYPHAPPLFYQNGNRNFIAPFVNRHQSPRQRLAPTIAPNRVRVAIATNATAASLNGMANNDEAPVGASQSATTVTSSGIGIAARLGNRGRVGFYRQSYRQNIYGNNPFFNPYGNAIIAAPLNTANDEVLVNARLNLQQLYAARAALRARLTMLEDEARRAGVAPGALR